LRFHFCSNDNEANNITTMILLLPSNLPVEDSHSSTESMLLNIADQ